MRTKGKVLFDDTTVANPVIEQAKKHQNQLQEESRLRAAERAARPVPNYICYDFLFPNYDPKTGKGCPRPLPKCRVCECILHPQEHHDCEGFVPKYVERDEEWYERMEQRRLDFIEARQEAIREARLNGTLYDECNEDYDEGDYCEGDDDGWECEDDGDPMWD